MADRPEPADQADAPQVVALTAEPPRAKATCYFCATPYDLGEPTGTLLIVYPEAEYRYWSHCLTEAHQVVMRAMDKDVGRLLARIPDALANAKRHQVDLANPTRRALSRLLA